MPARFRRTRLLVVGCGDVGLRIVAGHRRGLQWLALTSDAQRIPALRAAGIVPLLADLDQPASLHRLASLAPRMFHLAPPQREGGVDLRTQALLQAIARRHAAVRALVYVSTTGVYGDCAGAWVDETRDVAPANARAHRRVSAERAVRAMAQRGVHASVLRAPGIYALDRPHGTPRQRLLDGTPALREQDDVYTNHIHADDLARACFLALWRAGAGRVFNAVDDSAMKMGDYFDLAADRMGLPRAPRISREDAEQQLGALRMSFLRESRRLRNTRIRSELRMAWRYPTVEDGLAGVPR